MDCTGEMPKSSKELIKEIPGVGRYTAGKSKIKLNKSKLKLHSKYKSF